jgi:hypothetical protein
VKSRRSTFSISIFAPALYVRSTTLPDDVLQLRAHERAALAGLDVLELDDAPELAVDVEDDAVLDVRVLAMGDSDRSREVRGHAADSRATDRV